ncbi:MAG: hydroxyisourate hydrolase [Labilithrix sp.]|nr:hydroxyisourate hydrolase [Labilithrix sp.]MCW5812247.1 hydroxyisourate hydrolase [Labilithrix sp.]
MKSVSTHVLDIHRGRPAEGVPVSLEKKSGDAFLPLKSGLTDADGRVKDLVPEGQLEAGTYRITFDTGAYFAAQSVEGFYPEASIVFVVRDANAHYHVPLLLSAHGYSTYRGS